MRLHIFLFNSFEINTCFRSVEILANSSFQSISTPFNKRHNTIFAWQIVLTFYFTYGFIDPSIVLKWQSADCPKFPISILWLVPHFLYLTNKSDRALPCFWCLYINSKCTLTLQTFQQLCENMFLFWIPYTLSICFWSKSLCCFLFTIFSRPC